MTELKSALLPNRSVLKVAGEDAQKFLQGILTADIDALEKPGAAVHTGLLSPQGKILFAFFVLAGPDGFLIETDKSQLAELIKRLTMYKLRSAVTITDVSSDYTVAAVWGEGSDAIAEDADCLAFTDPRQPELGARLLLTLQNDGVLQRLNSKPASEVEYDAMRVRLGVPRAGKDYPLGDTFPHEALYDQLGSVSFEKGCYVGQEVVSRMQHRSTTRKRVVPVVADKSLPETGTDILAGSATIGTLGTVAGQNALAMVRLDRAAEALAKGEKLHAGDAELEIKLPPWATFKFPPDADPKA